MSAREVQKLIERFNIVVADQNQYTRKLTRMMLMTIGAKSIYEAADGVTPLDVHRTANLDVAIMDWKMRLVSGQAFESFDRQACFQSMTYQLYCSRVAPIACA
jgi:two-component system, chemotaxis family, chemotaxis protein CheY